VSAKNNSTEQDGAMKPLARRKFISLAALSGAGLASLSAQDQLALRGEGHATIGGAMEQHAAADGNRMTEETRKERIRRAMLAGPPSVTSEATIAEMDRQGNMTVLRPGTNDWVTNTSSAPLQRNCASAGRCHTPRRISGGQSRHQCQKLSRSQGQRVKS
jgi:hypothetical protein